MERFTTQHQNAKKVAMAIAVTSFQPEGVEIFGFKFESRFE